jgi:peptidoglycan/xylan/chitin deacetylase (PgdA/CDA1 family)
MDSYEYMAVPADLFEAHIKFIKDNFEVVSIADGLGLVCEGKPRGIYVSINLDDGYMDNYTHAFPIIKKYGLPATVFLATDFIGQDHLFWWDEIFQIIHYSGQKDAGVKLGNILKSAYKANRINSFLMNKKESEIKDFVDNLKKKYQINKKMTPNRMLGWREIKEMAGTGISFGSQTKAHKNLLLMEDNEIRTELTGSKQVLEERLGIKRIGFCYPFGKHDDRVRAIVRDVGFDYARTCIKGPNSKNIDRFSLRSIDASFVLNSALFPTSVSFHSLKG